MVYDFVLDTGIIMLTSYISDFTQLMLINVLAYTCIIFRYDSRLEGSHEPVKELVLLIYLWAVDVAQAFFFIIIFLSVAHHEQEHCG